MSHLLTLIVVLPLAGFSVTALIGRRLGKQAHWIPVGAIFLVWVIAMALVAQANLETSPLSSTDLPRPEPAHEEVRVRVRACGACRTDIHVIEGDLPARPRAVEHAQRFRSLVQGDAVDVDNVQRRAGHGGITALGHFLAQFDPLEVTIFGFQGDQVAGLVGHGRGAAGQHRRGQVAFRGEGITQACAGEIDEIGRAHV